MESVMDDRSGAQPNYPHRFPSMQRRHNVYVQLYTPTLDVLLKATSRYNMAKIQHRIDHQPTLTVVVPELSPDHRLKDWESIPSALVEVGHIQSAVGTNRTKMLSGRDVTRSAVTPSLMNPSWVHFTYHGEQYAHEPLSSRLIVYDDGLALEEILKLRPRNPEFVFLSACETAMDDTTLVNESMHLAGGPMAARFCGIIGTLWAIADGDSALVAKGSIGDCSSPRMEALISRRLPMPCMWWFRR